MIKWIDQFLNRITMYRLVLYYVLAIFAAALLASAFGSLPFSPGNLFLTGVVVLATCYAVNTICARLLGVPTNIESVYISAIIFTLIIPPVTGVSSLFLPVGISIIGMVSKYLVTIRKKHLFNPVAVAAVVMSLVFNQSANWWVDSAVLLPVILIGGILVVRKIRRPGMVVSFFAAAAVTIGLFAILRGLNPFASLNKALLHAPLLFFAFVMLTEPLTTPPTAVWQWCYGALVGVLFAPQIHLGQIYTTPELALLVGNIFSYIFSPKSKHLLTLIEKRFIAIDAYEFVFSSPAPVVFRPGQYLEWTLGHRHPDNRGNRRYFTIASSPTESNIKLGVKFYDAASSFKKSLFQLSAGDTIMAGQLAGDFVLPKDTKKKLVFIAGGIGITPYRSMVKYLIDRGEARNITLLYSNRKPADVLYQDVWDEATARFGLKIVETVSDPLPADAAWSGRTGFINEQMIREEVPDYRDRIFYISGPNAMVIAMRLILLKMGVPARAIKTDFFPGLV